MAAVFRFKKFEVSHHHSSMKVGTDALLLGAFLPVERLHGKGLEIGAGSGVVSLLLSTRKKKEFSILGIDIHRESVLESTQNFQKSMFKSTLKSKLIDFFELRETFDFIFSNPPYFSANNPASEFKRKVQHRYFCLHKWVKQIAQTLNKTGFCAYILPLNEAQPWIETHYLEGLCLIEQLVFDGALNKPRTLLIFSHTYASFEFKKVLEWKQILLRHQAV